MVYVAYCISNRPMDLMPSKNKPAYPPARPMFAWWKVKRSTWKHTFNAMSLTKMETCLHRFIPVVRLLQVLKYIYFFQLFLFVALFVRVSVINRNQWTVWRFMLIVFLLFYFFYFLFFFVLSLHIDRCLNSLRFLWDKGEWESAPATANCQP